jgi:hypothetical protein
MIIFYLFILKKWNKVPTSVKYTVSSLLQFSAIQADHIVNIANNIGRTLSYISSIYKIYPYIFDNIIHHL